MNKIFKVIYSKTKHCYVVVSELAKSHCKSTTGNISREHRTGHQLTAMVLTALMGFTFGIAIPSTSWALNGEDNKTPGKNAQVVGGKENTARGTDATIVGGSMNNTGTYGTLVAGGNSNVAASLVGDGNYRHDGDNSYYDECSTVVGGFQNTALGADSTLVGGSNGVVQGIQSTGIAGGSTGNLAFYALAMGNGSVVTNEGVQRTVKIAPNGSKRPEYTNISTALGYQATANQPGTISFGHDKGDVSGYTVKWVEEQPDALGVYHHTNADGTHYEYDVPPVITTNYYNSSYYNRLVKIADGINSHDAVTMEQVTTADNTKANVAADNIGSKLQVVKKDGSGNTITDSKTGLPVMMAASDTEKTANESAWGQALGTGAIVNANDQLVTGGTVYNAMLNKANVAMDNITNDGKTVIRNLAKEAVKVVDGAHTYVTSKSDGNATAYAVNIKTGQVASGDGDLVTGGTVYDAIQNAKMSGGSGQPVDISGKADVSAGNVGLNFTKYSDAASTDEQKQKEKIANENAWGKALGTGKIANSDATVTDADTNGSKQLVTGNTVYKEVRPTSDGTYIKTANTTAQNLTNLDKQVGRAVQYDSSNDVVDNTKITLAGKDGTTISNVKAGTANTDAVNVKQLTDKISDVTYTAGDGIDLTNKKISAKAGTGIKVDTNGISVKLGNHLSATGSDGAIDVKDDGSVVENNSGLVTGGTVYSALKQQKTDLSNSLSVNAGWGINIDKTNGNTISLKHNLGTGYNDNEAKGMIIGGVVEDRDATKQYGAADANSVIIGAGKGLASGKSSVVVGGLDNVAAGASSVVAGGDNNDAIGNQSAVFGGRDNTAAGIASTAGGGIMNAAIGQQSAVLGGSNNYVLGANATAIGGLGRDYDNGKVVYDSAVRGSSSVGIAGGSTGADATGALAAGHQAVVTTANGTAIGYQATTDEAGTIAFGHDVGDVSGYTIKWKQRTDGKTNADGTTNDYTQAPESVSVTKENTYTTAGYNRLVKVAEGQDDHDVVVVKQLKQYAQKDAGNIGSNIKVYTTDKNGNSVEDTDASTAAQKANENLWGTAIGTGKIADSKATNAADNGSQQLVTGGTVYTYNAPVAESGKTLNYVSADKTTGQNLTALDTQVKANADTLNDSTHNIKYYSVNSTNAPTFGLNVYTNEKNDGASGRASLAAGFITHADGLASTVAGSYSGIYNKGTVSGTDFRGAAALSLGTVNINRNMDTTKPYSGVANSLIGQANVTTDSNAAIILGAGNTVKDSYRTISNLNLSGDMTAALKEAVPGSGGQVMVMGGGNSVENAYMTQVTGVGNTVTGSGDAYDADKSSQLNYVEGFYTTLTNGKNDYLIGAHNTVTGDSTDTNKSNIVFGDNHTLTNTKNNIIVGSADNVDTTTVSDVVSIGHNAKVTKEGGVAIGSGSEATTAAGVAGYDPTGATADTTAAWTSKKAAVSVGTADETRQITGVAAGKEETDAVNVAQLKKLNGMKANVNADNIGKNLNHKADGTTVTDEDKTVNKNAWGAAIGTGSIAADNGQLVTGKTVYAYNKPVAAEGKTLNYISDTMTTGQNLTALDTQIKTNADNIGTNTTNISNNTENITNLKNLSNITEAGQTVIKNLAKGSIGMEDGSHTSVSHRDVNGVETYKVDVTVDGQVAENNTGIVNGGTVYSALQDVKNQTSADLANKANVDASNIGKNLNHKADGTAVTDEDKTVNENAWGAAIGTGSIAADNGQLVTGKTVYAYNKPVAAEGKTLNYVSDTKTTGQNLGSLDAQVGTNTGDISNLKNLSNISSAGETVIKNLAKGSIGMEDGSHTSVSHRDVNGVDTYKVDVTVDGRVTENNKGIVDGGTVYNAIQDVKTKTSADLANKANVDASNLSDDNVKSWQKKLGNGEVVSGNKGLVTGDTVFKAVGTKANRDGSNLTADEANKFSEKIAVGKVEADDKRAVSGETVSKAISDLTGDMNTKLDGKANTSLDNITKDGQTVIKKLSQDAVQVKAGDDHITIDAKTDETTGNKTYTISAKDGKVASDDTGLISGDTLYKEVHVDQDGSYIRSGNTVGQNLSALDSGLKTTSDLIHTNTKGDTIQIGGNSTATKIDVSGKDKDGNTTGRVITGIVTDGKDLTSAANVGYVNGITSANTQQIYRDMNNAYSRLDTNINRAAAGSNALAALHPLDFDPADKASFAVGYGHYHNANAAAIGAFYQPNANTMVNMGISLGNGDPGFNAGVSFKLGKGSAYNGVSKAEMAQTIHDQAEEISAIKANDAAKDKRIDALEKENQEMKKQIQEILSRLNG